MLLHHQGHLHYLNQIYASMINNANKGIDQISVATIAIPNIIILSD